MRIIQCESSAEAVDVVASKVFEKMKSHPASVIGLATGRTMVPVYATLSLMVQNSKANFHKCSFFMLDEYIGLPEDHPSSFKSYIKTHFIEPLKLSESQFAFPFDYQGNFESYERRIKSAGGIELQLLGIGINGHIGFNEPGSEENSRTRIVRLASETIEANRESFVDGKMPVNALSMGIGTIMESKNLVMLATGRSKADAVKYLLNHHKDLNCPATFLKDHPHFTLVLDPEAASKINLNI